MTEKVSQWLEEIKSLQQEITRVQQERDAAQASSDRWRGLYNTEAQQRRTEVQQYQEAISAMRSELKRLQEAQQGGKNAAIASAELQEELAELGLEQLKAKLIEASIERDRLGQELSRLAESLNTEKAAHEQTRQSLTSALGDTVELLKKAQPGGKTGVSLELMSLISGKPSASKPERILDEG